MENQISNGKIVDTTFFSLGFPTLHSDRIIFRDNYISQIEDYITSEAKVLFIEGEEDSGKTILCSQFIKRNVKNSISVFFNPLNSIDYQVDFFCSNVVNQLKFILNEDLETINIEKFISIEEYRQYLFQIRKFLKRDDSKIYLIVDGLEDKIKDNQEFISQIFSLLPFGEDHFRIIISGSQSDFVSIWPKLKDEDTKTISLTGFTTDEIIKYLELKQPIDNEIRDLFKITKGYPGRLKTLNRLIKNDTYNLEQIDKTTSYKKWIELDCNSVDLESPIINGILSVLSLNESTFDLEELAKISSLSSDEIQKIISELSVLEIIGNKVYFVSNSHKRYFSNILRANVNKTHDLLINYYANEETINSKYELSKLYSEKGQWPKIIDLIDEDYLRNIIESTGTIQKINESLELGVKASENMNKYTEMLRYSIQGSLVNELDNYLFWESEIKARISIRDFAGAISLAECAVLKVDRLRLFALIARKEKELNNYVDEELINQINTLYNNTNLTNIGDKIYDIVADLIYAIPNLAIELIEKSSGKSTEKNINDWIIAKLSIAAIDSSMKEEESSEKTKKLEALQNLNNPSVKKINRAISFLVGNYASLKVLEEVKKLSDTEERLRLLRLWLNNNRRNIKDIEKVIDTALDELIHSTSKATITLDVLKDLSYQLPYVKDEETRKELYNRFKTIDKDIADLGLTKNKYIYDLNIFHTEYTFDIGKSVRTINKIINEIDHINDILIKLEAYSEVYSKLTLLRYREFHPKINFVYSRILSLSEMIFQSTANHYKISQFVVSTIGKRDPRLALKISGQINTKFRREKARILLLDSYLDNNLKYVDIELLKEIESSFELSYSKTSACLSILERYSDAKSLHFNTIGALLFFIEKVDNFEDQSDKLFGSLLGYKIIVKNDEWKRRLAIKFEYKILTTWRKFEADWDRIDNGFIICSELAKINESFANLIFTECEEQKSASWIDSLVVAYTYLNNLKLIIRAFTGLLISKNDVQNDFKIIQDLIQRIPSEVERLRLWTELGFFTYSINDTINKNIYDNHILPLTIELISKKANLDLIKDALTLIHISNPELALDFIKEISQDFKEEVYVKICDYYLTKRNPFEFYDQNSYKANLSFNDITKAIPVIELIETDKLIYDQIDNICRAISENRYAFSKPQISTIYEKLFNIIKNKLPDTKNITHDGYKIIASLKITLIKKESANWFSFIDDSNKIPNLSDSIFVKSILLENLPFDKLPKGNDLKAKIFDEVIEGLNSMQIHYEFVQRVIDISDTMYNLNRNKWKDIVNKAFNISNNLEDSSEVYASKKNIIDSMYRLDPNYAKELIKSVDKEKINTRIGKLLKNYFDTLELSTKIKNNLTLEQREKDNTKLIVKAVFKALGSLNSQKITAKKIAEVSTLLPIGNKLPLHEAFPIYLFYMNNCSMTYRTIHQDGNVLNIHRENFKVAVNSTNLIQLLSQRRKFNEKSFRNFFIDEDFTTNKAIKPGSREEALFFIKNWMIDELEEFIIIADPYFQKEDLELIKLIKDADKGKDLNIDILISSNGQKPDIETEFKDYWRKISDELPPFTNITFVWIPEDPNYKPLHDRWLITKNSGLRMGTSLNSIGVKRESELSVMSANEALQILENTLNDYITRRKREINNQRLAYKGFNL